jgi:uncharacterized membrane protein YagU involved in acid resistance
MKIWVIRVILYIVIMAGLTTLLVSAGCAHCRPPEERAAKFGIVRECKTLALVKDGKRTVRCDITTPEGDDVKRYYGACQ